MRALVIGGSGFVGHAVVRALLSEGHAVSVLNRGNRPLDSVEQLTADRNDAKAVATAVDGKCFDCLVDTNAYTGEQAGIMVSALAGRVKQAAVISSAAVYADSAATPAREIDAIGGGSAWAEYGRGKVEVEEVYRTAAFPVCAAFRPPYICGPNNDLDRESWFFRRIWHGRPVLVPGSGSAVYQFLHEDDLGTAITTWLARPQDAATPAFAAYNLADPELVTSAELTALLARVAARKVDALRRHGGWRQKFKGVVSLPRCRLRGRPEPVHECLWLVSGCAAGAAFRRGSALARKPRRSGGRRLDPA